MNTDINLDGYRVSAKPGRPGSYLIWHEHCRRAPEPDTAETTGTGLSVGLILDWMSAHNSAYHGEGT